MAGVLTNVPLPADRLVARGDEMATLAGWLREAGAASSPRLGLVAGESGVGKSRLVADFARALDPSEVLVLWGACHGNTFLAYEPWVGALRELNGEGSDPAAMGDMVAGIPWLANAGAPVADQAGTPTEATVAEVATGILERAATGRTALIVLDDVQWADRGSIELLRRLLGASIEAPVLVVALERRPITAVGAWHEARVTDTFRVDWELGVTRLDQAGCAELLLALDARFDAPELTSAVSAASGGNVFAVRELATFVSTELARLRADDLNEVPGLIASLPA